MQLDACQDFKTTDDALSLSSDSFQRWPLLVADLW